MEYSNYFLTEEYICKNTKYLKYNTYKKIKKIDKKKEKEYYEEIDGNIFLKYFLILKYTLDKYDWDKMNNFAREEEEKMKIIEDLRKNKDRLKMLKIILKNIECNILETKMSLEVFINLCKYYDISLIISNKNISMYINPKEDVLPNFINMNENKNYRIKLFEDEQNRRYELNRILNNNLMVDNMVKPFKIISNYKLPELKIMVEKLKLGIDIKDKKLDLYNKMIEYIK
jgi:hypothetical protein